MGDIVINDATRAYLAAFDRWLKDPTVSNFEARKDCLLRVIGREGPPAEPVCRTCEQPFQRRPGAGRPRLHCERCRPVRKAAA